MWGLGMFGQKEFVLGDEGFKFLVDGYKQWLFSVFNLVKGLRSSLVLLGFISFMEMEDEDSEGLGSGESCLQYLFSQFYFCILFFCGEDGDGFFSDGIYEEFILVNLVISIFQLMLMNSFKWGSVYYCCCEVVLFGCGVVLVVIGLGFDLLEVGKCQLFFLEEFELLVWEEKKRWEGFFQRFSCFCWSISFLF